MSTKEHAPAPVPAPTPTNFPISESGHPAQGTKKPRKTPVHREKAEIAVERILILPVGQLKRVAELLVATDNMTASLFADQLTEALTSAAHE